MAHASADADEELVSRARELMAKEGLEYKAASNKVLREDRDLAERYRFMVGER